MKIEIPREVVRIAFASVKGINHALAEELLSRIQSEEMFFEATERQLSSLMGFSNKIFSNDYRASLIEEARKEYDFVKEKKIKTLYFTDNEYPQRLAECPDAPLILYTIGDCDLNKSHVVSIVGTRHATPYGLEFTRSLIKDIKEKVEGETIIISGLAYGIDVAAHKAALNENLPTVAVLAHGLNTIYPSTHRSIAVEMIKKGGMLISDYRSSATIHKGNFLARNRIVAGLCDCLIVVESAKKGGALVTARLACDYDREVMALPGRIYDQFSQGCNSLISNHQASLISNADNLIEKMNWSKRELSQEQKELFPTLSLEEETVYTYLRNNGEGQINKMTIDLNINIGKLTGILIELEFKGLVIPYPGAKYRLMK